jgi:hypothetical protein
MLTSELVESPPEAEVGAVSVEEVPMVPVYITDARFQITLNNKSIKPQVRVY